MIRYLKSSPKNLYLFFLNFKHIWLIFVALAGFSYQIQNSFALSSCLGPVTQRVFDDDFRYLISYIQARVANPTGLDFYNLNIVTGDVIHAVSENCQRPDQLDQIVVALLPTASFFTRVNDHDELLCTESGCPSRRPVLYNASDTVLNAQIIEAISRVPTIQRTPAMIQFVRTFSPKVLGYMNALLYGTGSDRLASVEPWGCARGVYNYNDFTQLKLNRALGDPHPSYCNAVDDNDMLAGRTAYLMIAANRRIPGLINMSPYVDGFKNYANLIASLIQSRMVNQTVTDTRFGTWTKTTFQPGAWADHPDYRYANYPDPTRSPLGTSPSPSPTVGMDVSHKVFLNQLLSAMYLGRSYVGASYPQTVDMQRYARSFVRSAYNYNPRFPLITNFDTGERGWYRVGYTPNFPGYPPYSLSKALFTQGYRQVAQWDPDLTRAVTAGIELLYASDAAVVAFRNNYYPDIADPLNHIRVHANAAGLGVTR